MTQSNTMARRALAAMAGLALSAALTGCGMSSLTSGLGSGVFGGSSATGDGKVSEEQLLAAAKSTDPVPATGAIESAPGCPKVSVWPRDNNLTIYEPGRVGDGLAIMHRGEITKTMRECTVGQGQVMVRYGFSGRVLLGPRGKSGAVTLPVNIFVTDSKRDKIMTETAKVDTIVVVENPIGYFSTVRTVTIPVPEGARPGEFELFVGFDRNTPNAG